jgi:hypothetical protein
VLQRFVKRYPLPAQFTFAHAVVDLRDKGIEIKRPSSEWTLLECLNNILGIWCAHLVERAPGAAVWIHGERNSYGCLRYSRPLDFGKRVPATAPPGAPSEGKPHGNLPTVKTMLLFDLVQTFRFRSEGRVRAIDGLQPMPQYGQPHYPLAAAFVSATFSTNTAITRKAAQSSLEGFLKKNKCTVAYYPWPLARHVLDVTQRAER